MRKSTLPEINLGQGLYAYCDLKGTGNIQLLSTSKGYRGFGPEDLHILSYVNNLSGGENKQILASFQTYQLEIRAEAKLNKQWSALKPSQCSDIDCEFENTYFCQQSVFKLEKTGLCVDSVLQVFLNIKKIITYWFHYDQIGQDLTVFLGQMTHI